MSEEDKKAIEAIVYDHGGAGAMVKDVLCPICLLNISPAEQAKPFCDHRYHKNCLGNHVMKHMNSGPMCSEDECGKKVPADLI
eukprot:CAMPEP_0170481464 /NCGR_PEP_ID=MMETSP0208-20121228/1896_1 /TAXON_ID=197538 /ORGANISM="Strombidium inclinatum, Strain S3" /LENGTH=82 /DNA_ID=CAMNT_0010754173 /DNA_START=4159 /DNA_END=4407 /DNA_ORIENTATION=+